MSRPANPQLSVKIGEFVACVMPTNNPISVTVGKVLAVRAGEEGTDILLHGYIPRTVSVNAPRSKYGRGGWTEEFVFVDKKRVPSTGWEDVVAVSAKFEKLTSSHKLPRVVWKAAADSADDAEGDLDDIAEVFK